MNVAQPDRQTQLLFRNDARTQLGRLTMAGFICDSSGVCGTPRVLGSYALVFLLAGSGMYHDAHGRAIRVRAGEALLLFPELAHTYGPGVGERWSEFYCVFDGPAFDMLRGTGLLDPARLVLRLQPIAAWLARLEAAMPQPGVDTLAGRLLEVSRFVGLLTEIVALGAPEPLAAVPPWIAEACRCLREQLDRESRPEDVAAALQIPYETFRKHFQQHVGVSPGRYRTIRRIDAACALLQDARLTTQAIAAQLGFSDEFHFSRRFKQITGTTPREFRRRLPSR